MSSSNIPTANEINKLIQPNIYEVNYLQPRIDGACSYVFDKFSEIMKQHSYGGNLLHMDKQVTIPIYERISQDYYLDGRKYPYDPIEMPNQFNIGRNVFEKFSFLRCPQSEIIRNKGYGIVEENRVVKGEHIERNYKNITFKW
jgi:hypothetical protein